MRLFVVLWVLSLAFQLSAGKKPHFLRKTGFHNPALLDIHSEEPLELAILSSFVDVPSAEPTQEPTIDPSIAPTLEPTAQPTNPTITPTFSPTPVPSIAPSRQSAPILSFDTTVTIGGSVSTLDVNGQKAVVNATATSMGVSQNDITYKGSIATAESRRRLSSGTSLFATTYKIVATTGVTVLVTSGSSEDFYAALVTAIETAVLTGQFTTNLQRAAVLFNSPALANANVTSVVMSDPVTKNPPGSKNPALSVSAIAGIVIGGVIVTGLAIALLYLHFREDSAKSKVAAYS